MCLTLFLYPGSSSACAKGDATSSLASCDFLPAKIGSSSVHVVCKISGAQSVTIPLSHLLCCVQPDETSDMLSSGRLPVTSLAPVSEHTLRYGCSSHDSSCQACTGQLYTTAPCAAVCGLSAVGRAGHTEALEGRGPVGAGLWRAVLLLGQC